ncbi:MAG: hypothetical protein HUJ25_06970 [Crocinitomicaceae bacterium]|nr:hypothetical protein [Crocinitomicaceae bacterium]
MRKINFFLLCFVCGTLTTSCKKGENDPFLSIYSRKARMHGEWNIGDYSYNDKTSNADGDYVSVTETYEENEILRITEEYSASNGTISYDTSLIIVDYVKYTFDKAGTWSVDYYSTERWTNVQYIGGSMSYDTLITVKKISESGDWSFLGKVEGEYKNKERIALNLLSQTKNQQITSYNTTIGLDDTVSTVNYGSESVDVSNYYSGENNTIIEIDQLKRKEMIFKEKRKNSGSYTVIPYQGNPTTTINDEFYSESVLILERI